jgi:shikimate kinase/3-dehydroquinate synthase
MKNVALIGFMGSGKSTVGVELARRLGVRFVETDTLIEEASNKSVSRIFAEEGERAFRRRERSAIQTVTLETDQVISCGGGVTIDPRNLRLLRMSCRVVLLKADPEVLYERIKKSDSRPLAKNLRTPGDVARLVHERSDAYAQYDLCVDAGACSVAEAVEAIAEWVCSQESDLDTLRLQIDASLGPYTVVVGPGMLSQLGLEMRSCGLEGKAMLFSNGTVDRLYGDRARQSLSEAGFNSSTFLMADGEEYKTLDTALQAYKACNELGLDRRSTIVALGGGVVGDVAGFVAGTYMRGINLVQVPTTLLAMVDSSVGGKTAVNMPFGKNMVGVFYQPRLVIADPDTLSTLTSRDYRAGMAELLKHGLILDPALLDFLMASPGILLSYSQSRHIVSAIAHSCAVKADIVEADETDRGLREVLNAGHTVGHALELVAGYGRLRHGEAVALGIIAETDAANAMGIASDRCLDVVRTCFRPLVEELSLSDIDPSSVCQAMMSDKKKRGDRVFFSVVEEVGTVKRGVEIDGSVLKEAVARTLAEL